MFSRNELDAPRFVLIGAALDTANLGVAALSLSTIVGVHRLAPDSKIAVFDFGRGVRERKLVVGGEEINIICYGSIGSRNLFLRESVYNMALSSLLGGTGHPGIEMLRNAEAVLDISGGDSFSDIYGARRFRLNTLRKKLALREGRALALLPQTYGPYLTNHAHNVAQKIVRRTSMAWSRDKNSFEVLKNLLGTEFDPSRHRSGVDVAFGLPVTRPGEDILSEQLDWFNNRQSPLVGLNVSGLLLNRPKKATVQYGLKADYERVILSFLRRLLKDSDARVLLIPHVVASQGHYESDIEACEVVASALGREYSDRASVAPVVHDPCEVKWMIAQCDWFCGTRMHSAIAALSSGVPTAAVSYSPKTLGVFETCEQGAHVADPCRLDTGEMVDHLWKSWLGREEARRTLQNALPVVLRQAEEQMAKIVTSCIGSKSPSSASSLVS